MAVNLVGIYSLPKKIFFVTSRASIFILLIVVAGVPFRGLRVVNGAGPITEYQVPLVDIGGITEVATGGDGKLWLINSTPPNEEVGFGQIIRMSPGEPGSFDTTGPIESRLTGVTSGQFGEILFAEPDRRMIGRILPAAVGTQIQVEEIPLAIQVGRPLSVAALGNAIWFTVADIGQIGRVTLDPERTTGYFSLETEFSSPSAILAGPDRQSLYFINTSSDGYPFPSTVGRITLGGAITEFPLPNAESRPSAMTLGPDGNFWLTDAALNAIWRMTPEGDFVLFRIPTAESNPAGIVAGPDGKLYFTESAANQIGVITTGGAINEIPVPTEESGPSGITVGSDGDIWFTESVSGQIGRLALAADLRVSATISQLTVGKGQDVTLSFDIANQGPDSVANAALSLRGLLPYYSILACNPGAAGGACLPNAGETPDYLIRIPFIPNGGVVTAVVVARVSNCAVSAVGAPLPEISSAITVVSRVPDLIPENNNLLLTVNASPPAKVTIANDAAEITFGPIIPRVSSDPNAPVSVLSLENIGCAPIQLTVDSLRRVPSSTSGSGVNGTCAQSSPVIGDDFNFFEIGTIEFGGTAFSAASTRALRGPQQAFQIGPPLRNGTPLPVIPPGGSLRLAARFKAILPGFAGDGPLSTDDLLPSEVQTLFTLSAAAGTNAPATTVRIKGLISPAAQIVPRDSADSPLVQLTTSGDKFEVRFSAFDAKLNVRRAAYQFFDRYRGAVTAPINVPLESAICQKGVMSGQSFTIVARFNGATEYPEIAHVQVTVFDDEGSSAADTFSNNSPAARTLPGPRRVAPQRKSESPRQFSQISSASVEQPVSTRNAAGHLTTVSPPSVDLPLRATKPDQRRNK